MRYRVVFEKSKTGWGAYVPRLPGVGVVADSKAKVRQLIRTAIRMHLKGMREDK